MPPRSKIGAKSGRVPKSTPSISKPSLSNASSNSSIIQDKLRQGPKKLGFLIKSSQNNSVINSSQIGVETKGAGSLSFQEDDGFFYSRSQPSQSQSQSSQSIQFKKSSSQYLHHPQLKKKSLRLNNFTKGKSIFDDDEDENDGIFGRPIAEEFKRQKQNQSKQRSVSAPVKLTTSANIMSNHNENKDTGSMKEIKKSSPETKASKIQKPTATKKRSKTPRDDLHDIDKEMEEEKEEEMPKLFVKKRAQKTSTAKNSVKSKPAMKKVTSSAKKAPLKKKVTQKKASTASAKPAKTLLDILDDTFEYDSDEEENDNMFSLETPVRKKQKVAVKLTKQDKISSKVSIPKISTKDKPKPDKIILKTSTEPAKEIGTTPRISVTKRTSTKKSKKVNSKTDLRNIAKEASSESKSALGKKSVSINIQEESSPRIPESYDNTTTTPIESTSALKKKGHGNLLTTESYEGEVTTTIVPLNFSPLKRSLVKTRQERRRSSLGNRGKRISSVGNGFQAEPHKDIPLDQLYKHFDSDLPDPHKMRQLLVWCAKRNPIALANPSRKSVGGGKSISERIANVIRDEMIRDLSDGKINTSWWNAEDNENALDDLDDGTIDGSQRPIFIRPNEANVENKKLYEIYDRRLHDLSKEKNSWLEAKPSLDEVNNDLTLAEDNLNDGTKDKIDKIEKMIEVLNNYKNNLNQNKLVVYLENFKLTIHKLKESKDLVNLLTDTKLEEVSKRMKYLIDHDNDGNKVESVDLLKSLVEF